MQKLHAKNGLGVTLGFDAGYCPELFGQRRKELAVCLHVLK